MVSLEENVGRGNYPGKSLGTSETNVRKLQIRMHYNFASIYDHRL